MHRILFGDNQFFGINHMSDEKARAQSVQFRDIESIIKVIDIAYDAGIKVFMCTTHDRVAEICDHVRANPVRYASFEFYPCMPYAHKYANAATEHGIIGSLRKFMPDDGIFRTVVKGGMSIAKKDMEGIAQILIDTEMKMFAGLKTPAIFLQNVATDFLLGLGFHDAFRIFADHVVSRYGAEPGFITMNAPRLLKALTQVGISNPIICANYNKIGFRMCGGKEAYDKMLSEGQCRFIAMSVFASGSISASEALEYVCDNEHVESILFGASSKNNILQTKKLIEELTKSRSLATSAS
jgi:hypothetical protein